MTEKRIRILYVPERKKFFLALGNGDYREYSISKNLERDASGELDVLVRRATRDETTAIMEKVA